MWKTQLYRKIPQYMKRDIRPGPHLDMFLNWWHVYAEEILNEFEFALDDEVEKGRADELKNFLMFIQKDSRIDQINQEVQRIIQHGTMLINELEQEVDYANPSREDLEREDQETAGVDS